MGSPRKYTAELLAPMVERSASVAEVLRRLGLRANGGSHAHLSGLIKRYGLDTAHFRRGPIGGPVNRLAPEQILVRSAMGSRRQKPRLLRRAMIEMGVRYSCAACGNDGWWLGRELILEVDHIDGDFYNNELANLRFLCPNCHRQTPNHAGRSAGSFSGSRPRQNGGEAE